MKTINNDIMQKIRKRGDFMPNEKKKLKESLKLL